MLRPIKRVSDEQEGAEAGGGRHRGPGPPVRSPRLRGAQGTPAVTERDGSGRWGQMETLDSLRAEPCLPHCQPAVLSPCLPLSPPLLPRLTTETLSHLQGW